MSNQASGEQVVVVGSRPSTLPTRVNLVNGSIHSLVILIIMKYCPPDWYSGKGEQLCGGGESYTGAEMSSCRSVRSAHTCASMSRVL